MINSCIECFGCMGDREFVLQVKEEGDAGFGIFGWGGGKGNYVCMRFELE